MMVFIPADHDHATALRAAGSSDEQFSAFAATGQMIKAHDYRPDEREDADYAAQLYASLAGLATSGDDRRLVLAADVPIARVHDGATDGSYGAITVTGLDWSDVRAVFVDAPEAVEAVRKAKQALPAAAGDGLDAVLGLGEVTALTDDHELLWHTPDEDW
ncbi:hypothetical protein GCM10011575_26320 [Microlunatus endophyticus]|uniref:Uncharacterized protein n=2 Tax=Microlunatus endophyticus TaxID=1716077 RepID=A0A917SAA2_9ACTN|nr:hypothetical protein GCM10011575_26320 [Microlunatus endophyticus]